METYTIKRPICITFDGAMDASGEPLSGIQAAGSVQLNPEHPATVSWLENDCIEAEKSAKKPARGKGKEKE